MGVKLQQSVGTILCMSGPMKTNFKPSFRTMYYSRGAVICAGAVLLIASRVQGQNLFVSCWGNNVLYEITPAGVQSTFASGFNESLQGLAFNSAGNLFMSVTGGEGIWEFTPGGVRSSFASGFTNPYQLAFNSAGDLFVADCLDRKSVV